MEKVYILMGEKGFHDLNRKIILDVFATKEKANTEKEIAEKQMDILQYKYSSEEIEKLEDEDYDYKNPPEHIKKYNRWQCEMDAEHIHSITINEFLVK